MRLVVLLLVAAVIGFAVGRLTAPDVGGRGGERSVRLPAVPSPEPGVAPSEAPPPGTSSVAEAPAPMRGVALPTRPASEEEEEDEQYLEVDFTGFTAERTAWVALRSMKGTVEVTSYEADEDGVARVWLSPGTYEVWWFGGDGAGLGTRARLEDGKVTVLRAVDHASPAPMPAGLGLLRLEVVATWGGGLGDEYVRICDRENSSELYPTDARGHACVNLSPGRYVAEIGEHRSDFAVEEGRMTHHRIQHEREGDLVLVSDRRGPVWIRRAEPAYGDSCWVGGGEDAVVPYVLEGEYEITAEGFASLGRATVHAGRTTRFRCELPPGGVSVRVMKHGAERSWRATITIRRGIDGHETERSAEADVNSDSAEIEAVALPPGSYVVTASAADCEPASVEVDVTDRMVDLELSLEYRR